MKCGIEIEGSYSFFQIHVAKSFRGIFAQTYTFQEGFYNPENIQKEEDRRVRTLKKARRRII